MKYIAVYGSLRPGHYNFKRFNDVFPGFINHIETHKINGYKLYNLGAYPAAVESGDLDDTIEVDILEITDPYIYSSIKNMELGAGYYVEEIDISNHTCEIFLKYEEDVKQIGGELVKSGNWNNL
jgi:gamma-glutamylcyclotransferase (GGCT)/AIG2-like uncharacterized protein YtfP